MADATVLEMLLGESSVTVTVVLIFMLLRDVLRDRDDARRGRHARLSGRPSRRSGDRPE